MMNEMASNEPSNREHVVVHGIKHFVSKNKCLALTSLSIKMPEEIEGLEQLQDIEYIDLSKNLLKSLPDLRHFSNLEEIIANNNQIEIPPNFSGLEKLKYVDLSNNALTTSPDFTNCNSLNNICLATNRISRLEHVDHLLNLEKFIADDNLLESTSGLEGCVRLWHVIMNRNRIHAIEGFASLPALSNIELEDNLLESLDGLPWENDSLCVHARRNKIKHLHIKESMVLLDVSENEIERVEVDGDAGFWWLNLSRNNIKDISWLEHVVAREELDMSSNRVDPDQVQEMARRCNFISVLF